MRSAFVSNLPPDKPKKKEKKAAGGTKEAGGKKTGGKKKGAKGAAGGDASKKASVKKKVEKGPNDEDHDPNNPNTKYYHNRIDMKDAVIRLTAISEKDPILGRFLLREDLAAAQSKEDPDDHWISVVVDVLGEIVVKHYRIERSQSKSGKPMVYKINTDTKCGTAKTLMDVVNHLRNTGEGIECKLSVGYMEPNGAELEELQTQRRRASTRSLGSPPPSAPPPRSPTPDAVIAEAPRAETPVEEAFDGFGDPTEDEDDTAPAGFGDTAGGDESDEDDGGFGTDVSEDDE
jgi:hypothetical protein